MTTGARILLMATVLSISFIAAISGQVVRSPGRFPEVVKINPGQRDLFLTEADKLRQRTNQVRQEVAALEAKQAYGAVFETVQARTRSEMDSLEQTQSSFSKQSTDTAQRQAGELFFGDLRRRYAEAATQAKGFQPAIYKPGAKPTLRVFDENVSAYTQVASSGSLTFNLQVKSAPPGAAVEYRRVGDPYARHNDPTATTLYNLVLAQWQLRATLDKTQQEKLHDPFREPDHVVVFDFSK